jgi:hypothetical protein
VYGPESQRPATATLTGEEFEKPLTEVTVKIGEGRDIKTTSSIATGPVPVTVSRNKAPEAIGDANGIRTDATDRQRPQEQKCRRQKRSLLNLKRP